MGCVSLLPKELSGPGEGSWMLELPSDDIGPLVQLEWKVSVALDPVGIGWVHDCLAGWTNGDWLAQIAAT